jgi:DNA-binding transcriptional regulator GbsR (MarR family)
MMPVCDDVAVAQRHDEDFRSWFIDRFAAFWSTQGAAKSEGRIVGFLLVCGRDAVSAAEIAAGAGVSAGSVSTGLRRLTDLGFVRQVPTANRARSYTMDEDVWGGFLRNERDYLKRQHELAQSALDALPHLDERSRHRLVNMRDYMSWLDGYHDVLSEQWERTKAERDARGVNAGQNVPRRHSRTSR